MDYRSVFENNFTLNLDLLCGQPQYFNSEIFGFEGEKNFTLNCVTPLPEKTLVKGGVKVIL